MITSRLADGTRRASAASAAFVAGAVQFVVRNPHFALALFTTAIFYYPALRNNSVDAGFLYGGDTLGGFWPSLIKTQALLGSLHFNALDFSLFGGSSDFYLAPNFSSCYPAFVLYALFTGGFSPSMWNLGHLLVVVLALNSFAACYFSTKLLTRFYLLDFGVAGLAGVAFAFSQYMLSSLGEPMFILSVAILPWAAYGMLAFEERRSAIALITGAFPVTLAYLGGYLPLGLGALGLALVMAAVKLLVVDELGQPLAVRIGRVFAAMGPFVAGSIVVAPYMLSVYMFLKATNSGGLPSLFFSAHQLGEYPQNILRLLSFRYYVPGPIWEFSIIWGIIPCVVAAMSLLTRRVLDVLSVNEMRVLKIAAVIYFLTAMAIFGDFSVVSDLVYYFVPQIGKMHIYQRFLIANELMFGVMVGLMLKSLIVARPAVMFRIAFAVCVAALMSCAYVVARYPATAADLSLNNYIVFELGLAVLLVIALILGGRTFVYCIAIVLFALPALDRMYDLTQGTNTLEQERTRQPFALDESMRERIVSYFKRADDKQLVKYVDITPRWGNGTETFPKNFPYFVLNDIALSSYGGFNFPLAARADFMARMPVVGPDVRTAPNWDVLEETGTDFVVARNSDLKSGDLAPHLSALQPGDMLQLPNGLVIAPLRKMGQGPQGGIYDNGYVRVVARERPEPIKLTNIARGKHARQSSTLLGAGASRAVDGNTDGDFAVGSVSHTKPDRNAWLDIDLGSVELIDSVRIWNRTDGAGFRLSDFWIFISDAPFGDKDTADMLRKRPGTWGRMSATPSPSTTIKTPDVRGRYVRVQLGGKQPLDQAMLSVAEIEVFKADTSHPIVRHPVPNVQVLDFHTNGANSLRLDLESSGPASVEYLLWPNPRLKYYVNGEATTPRNLGGLSLIDVPAGRSVVEIRYRNWSLTLFWFIYAVYFAAWIVAVIASSLRMFRSSRGLPEDEVPIEPV